MSISARTTCSVCLDQVLSLFRPCARPVYIVRPGKPIRPVWTKCLAGSDYSAYSAYLDHVFGLLGLFFLVGLLGPHTRPVWAVLPYQPIRVVLLYYSAWSACSAYSATYTCSDQVLGMFGLFGLGTRHVRVGLLGLGARPVWLVRIKCSVCLGCSNPSAYLACSDQELNMFELFFPAGLLESSA
ncbi:hypothetical protein L484_017835 [Morus notabilis]|uniref:Uncharacterized protein n=1 Tax=Morus notabilis TaxID=981085 RepID=W9RC33_9ROSA|nr:hypothetical protein L484_017835 [Morus notabilis]